MNQPAGTMTSGERAQLMPVEDAVAHIFRNNPDHVSRGARFLVIVEDPGAGNFAAAMLPALERFGEVSVFARGAGSVQLTRLNVEARDLPAPFDVDAFLGAQKPALLVAGTSENADAVAHEIIAACRALGVPTLCFVDGPANIDRRFRGGGESPLAFAPDWVLVPSTTLQDQLCRLGLAEDRVLAVQHPHFTHLVRERVRLEGIGRPALRARLFPGVTPDRQIVVFLAERSDGLEPDEFVRSAAYSLEGRGGDHRRTNIVLEEVLDALDAIRPKPYVVVRLHPKNELDEFAGLANEFDRTSLDEPIPDLVFAADLVVGLTTIALSEAAALGRPVLSVLPRELEKDWLLNPPGRTIDCVSNRAALRAALCNLSVDRVRRTEK